MMLPYTSLVSANALFLRVKRYTAVSIFLVVSLMAMTILFAALIVSFGGGDRSFGLLVLLLIYLFGALSVGSVLYLDSLEKSRGRNSREIPET